MVVGRRVSWRSTVFSTPEPHRSGAKKLGSAARTHGSGTEQYRNVVSRLSHSHALHIRCFWKRLEEQERHVAKSGSSASNHWRVDASVHYEGEHANPLHA